MTTKREVRVTEDYTAEPFRLFGNLEHKWFQVEDKRATDISFHIRPMKSSEKAVFKAAEEALRRSLDYNGAFIRAGVDKRLFDETNDKKLTAKEKEELKRKSDEGWASLQRNLLTDLEEVERFAEVSKATIVACVDKYKVGEFEKAFDEEVYEQITLESVKVWLLDCIEKSSTITEGERVGL